MRYEQLIKENVMANLQDIRSDLELARHKLRVGEADIHELRGTVATLESLLRLVENETPATPPPTRLTLHDAMKEVLLTHHLGLCRAGELAAEINRRGLYRMRDGRPVESQQIHARVRNYDHMFEKEGTFIKLKSPVDQHPTTLS